MSTTLIQHVTTSTQAYDPQGYPFQSVHFVGQSSPPVINQLLNSTLAVAHADDVIGFWDVGLGRFPDSVLAAFLDSSDDVWHPGTHLTGADTPDLLRYIIPFFYYRLDPHEDVVGAVNWKIDLRAALIRARALHAFGGLHGAFASLQGASRELGFRWFRAGVILRQRPDLLPMCPSVQLTIPLEDRYRLVQLHFGRRRAVYILIRRLLSGARPLSELSAWQRSMMSTHVSVDSEHPVSEPRHFSGVALANSPRVSVVIPTYRRYKYLAQLLDDIRRQTIKPIEILVADGNSESERQAGFYGQYSDLPIRVILPLENGTCTSRNACLAVATGEFIWFLDDDSRIGADNLECHLNLLAAYSADVSVGPAVTARRPHLHASQAAITHTAMDCGTTLCRRLILEKAGGFDLTLNQAPMGEDADLGFRFLQAGGLMLNNPSAKRFHYHAQVGGAPGRFEKWRRWDLSPRPPAAVFYLAHRHFKPEDFAEILLERWVLMGWKRFGEGKSSLAWKILTCVYELIALPISLVRLIRCVAAGRRLTATGRQIPRIPPLL